MLINQLKKYGGTTIVVIASAYMSFRYPLAKDFLRLDDVKTLTTIDLAVYNFLFSFFIGFCWNFIKEQLLMVDIDLKSSQQTNHIYLSKDDVSDDNPTEILVRATFTFIGTRRIKYKKNEVVISFPSSYSAQTPKGYKYVKERTEDNSFIINLSEMIEDHSKKAKHLDMVKTIDFSLTLDEYDKNNKDTIKFETHKKACVLITSKNLILEQQ